MNSEIINFVKNLSLPEKAELMEYITMDLSTGEDAEVLAELDKRHATYLKDPTTAKTWDEVKARVFKKYGF